MTSYTSIQRFTPAVLAAVCRQKGLTPEQLRLGTLKSVEAELDAFLRNPLLDLHADDHAALEDLRSRVRLAIGDE
jgi:hypothetical protein